MSVQTYRTAAPYVALHGASTEHVTGAAADVVDEMNRRSASDEEIVAYVNGLPGSVGGTNRKSGTQVNSASERRQS